LNEIIKKKHKKHTVIVIDPVGQFFKKTFDTYDLSEQILDGTLIICTTEDEVLSYLSVIDTMIVVQNYLLIAETYVYNMHNEYNELMSYTSNIVNQMQCNTGTVMGAGKEIAENDIINLPYIIKHRGVSDLKDLYKNKPAVLVSTGPSLQKNIHLLRNIQDKVVIIAVAQALRILLAYDITPDFISTVDYGKVNLDHYKGLMDSQVPLVCLNRTYSPILKQYKGPKFIVGTPTPGYPENVTNIIEEKGTLDQGGSVSHMNLSLADHLGCDPIALIGQDLALTNGKSHFKQADASGDIEIDEKGNIKWIVNDPKSDLHSGVHSMGNAVSVDGYFGSSVLTNIGLVSFIHSFNNLVKKYDDKTIINCTEGGADIIGTRKMTLHKYIDNYCKYIVNKNVLSSYVFSESVDKDVDRAIDLLDNDIKILHNIKEYSGIALKTVEKIRIETDKIKIAEYLKENTEYSNKAYNETIKNPLVPLYIYAVSRKIMSRQLNVDSKDILNNEDDMKVRVDRNEMILKAANDASIDLIEKYQKSYDILKEYRETGNEALLIEDSMWIPDITEYKKYLLNDNWAYPLLESSKVLNDPIKYAGMDINLATAIWEMCNDKKKEFLEEAIDNYEPNKTDDLLEYNKLIKKAHTLGKEDQDFKTCLNILKEAEKIQSIENKQLLWQGMATTFFLVNDVDNSLKYFEKIIDSGNEDLQIMYEYGNVMLNKDLNKGLEIVKDVMSKTDKYDSFFAILGKIYEKDGNYKSAIDAYKQYTKIFPGDVKIMERLAYCYEQTSQREKLKRLKTKIRKLKT
jgi:uncharacterized protein YktA (UPF0223 family)